MGPTNAYSSYHSIRIDPVHYCELEGILAEQRKRKSWANQNADPEPTAEVRVHLLCRTLRNDTTGALGAKIQFLKIAYMARESCKADLARIVAVTPNLKYIDLPRGCYTDNPTCTALIAELQGSCRDLRKMKFKQGGEKSLELLMQNMHWANLAVLELKAINLDTILLRKALGALTNLRALKIKDMATFSNNVFVDDPFLPSFPALYEVAFENTPNLSAAGLCTYLRDSDAQEALTILSLTNTGVHISTVHDILYDATSLQRLSITEHVATGFPTFAGIRPLCSDSIELIHFEITSDIQSTPNGSPTQSYYNYLRHSILRNCLPNLQTLYVRDPTFSESLAALGSPGRAAKSSTTNGNGSRFSSNNPFAAAAQTPDSPTAPLMRELEIYTKSSSDHLGWNQSFVSPNSNQTSSRPKVRPSSTYGLGDGTSKSWTEEAGARKSVMFSDGTGNFLTVPGQGYMQQQNLGPFSEESGEERSPSYDMWR